MIFAHVTYENVAGLLAKAEPGDLAQGEMDDAGYQKVPVLRDAGGREIHPFRFLSLGIMAYLGNDRAGA